MSDVEIDGPDGAQQGIGLAPFRLTGSVLLRLTATRGHCQEIHPQGEPCGRVRTMRKADDHNKLGSHRPPRR
jgi:hypothetical protein